MERTKNVVSMREVQRNYKRIFEKVRKTKKPVFLGRYAEPSVVVLDIDSFETLRDKAANHKKEINWKKIYDNLKRIAKNGRINVNLAEFIIRDRESH